MTPNIKTLSLLVLVSRVFNDQKTCTFTQYLSNAVVQNFIGNFNDFLNKRERERVNESNRDFVLNRMKNN